MDFDKWASMVHDTNALVLTDLDGRMAMSPNSVFAVRFATLQTRKSVSTSVIFDNSFSLLYYQKQ